MISRVRITTGALAIGLLVCHSISAHPEDVAPLQKSPILLPEKLQLPATLPVQYWMPSSGAATNGPVSIGIPIVIVSIDESRSERAAIATGLNANVVSTEASMRLKLPAVSGSVKIDALTSNATANQAEVQRFRASTIDLPKLVFAVADVPSILSSDPHPDAPASWLGTPFLSAFQVTFDPGGQSVTLDKTTSPLPRRRETSVSPMSLRDNRPYVRVTIPGAKPFEALIDTTSPGTVIPTEVGEKLKLKPTSVKPITRRDGKKGNVALVVAPKLSVGKAEWKSAHVVYITSDSSKEFDRNFAVLGMDFIGQFKMTLDFKRAQVALSPKTTPTTKPADEVNPTP